MLSKLQVVLIAILLISTTANAQCPSVTSFSTATNKANECPGEAQGPTRSTDFVGGPYYSIPTSGKQGDIAISWGSAQSILPAIQAIYEGPTRTTLVGGPAATQASNSTSYCYYGTTGMASNPDVTFFFVNPINDTAFYSCSYRKSGPNYVTLTQPTITTQPTTQHACVGFSTSFTVAATAAGGGALSYQWLKNNAVITGATSSTYTISSVAASDTGRYSCVVAEANRNVIRSNQVSLTIDSGIVWTGATSTAWNLGSNWVGGAVPTSTTNAYIASATNAPLITGSRNCRCMVLGSGNLTINGGTLSVRGDISSKGGTITATNGTVVMNGATRAQTIGASTFASNTVNNLTINNTFGVSLSGALIVTGAFTPTAGVFTTNSNLTIASSASGTGRVAAGSTSGGYISGDVTMQRYIPGGRRAFRFFTHPFTNAFALSNVIDDVDITGNGGATNGFTATQNNNPSAFWFDPAAADTATSGANSGWTAYTNTTSDTWDQYEMMRMLVRGAKGEGLSGGTYTPSATTIDLTGTLNQGNQTITLTKGTNTSFFITGNPFASPVNMSSVTTPSNLLVSSYYVWDANQGLAGGYTSYPFGGATILPPFGSFVVELTASSSITFNESAKSSSSGISLFKGTAANGYNLQVRLTDSNTFWDRVLLILDSSSLSVLDQKDAKKLYNPNLDFYTISTDTVRLSIDARSYVDSQKIPLGVTAYNRYNDYTFTFLDYDVPQGVKLYLEDTYLNTTTLITDTLEYKFTVTTDTATQGNRRFYIRQEGMPTNSISEINTKQAYIQIAPNPVENDKVNISYNELPSDGVISIISTTGQVLQKHNVQRGSKGVVMYVEELPSGIYIIQIEGTEYSYNNKFIKK